MTSLANLTTGAERRCGDHEFRGSGSNGDPMLRNGIVSVRSLPGRSTEGGAVGAG